MVIKFEYSKHNGLQYQGGASSLWWADIGKSQYIDSRTLGKKKTRLLLQTEIGSPINELTLK